jgi:hypothetical protein
VATIYLLLSAAVDSVGIYLLGSGDPQYDAQTNFRMALATTSLFASLLCVWVLLVSAFARKSVSRLKPGTTLVTALTIAIPLVLSGRLLRLIDPHADWSPTLLLLFALLWSSIGLHAVLWYLTTDSTACSDET